LRVLLIKTSSLGDVIHALPALTDAARAIPGIKFDWVVEEGFAEIPTWHPAVDKVIPVAIRRWRKNLWQTLKSGEWKRFKQSVRAQVRPGDRRPGPAQKRLADPLRQAPVAGLDKGSAREPIAARFYDGAWRWPVAARGGAGAPVVRHRPRL
jgi:heptosyltransferase-1